ncbi:MAG: PEP-CTERM/exosortase system-associated acyltransferase, partial [Nitrosomonas sp.]|nr:PEP-CTERM/exosortase system-associated acyltransferase [Nitrosomonas sp.]
AASVVRMCDHSDIRNWLSVMDPALNRLLSSFGLDLDPIGPTIEYHGLRQPYFMKVADALDKMKKKNHEAWEVVTDHGKYCSFLAK